MGWRFIHWEADFLWHGSTRACHGGSCVFIGATEGPESKIVGVNLRPDSWLFERVFCQCMCLFII